MARDAETAFAIEWEVLKDANGVFGTILDA